MNNLDFLASCPWCKSTPEIHAYRTTRARLGHTFRVLCENRSCEINPSTVHYETREEAIAAWNVLLD